MASRSTSLSSFMYTDDWLAMSGYGTMTSLPFGRATGKWNSTIIAAVAMGAIFAVSVGVALSTGASGRATELLSPARFASKAANNELLKYSRKKAEVDMESYFDKLPGGLPNANKKTKHAREGHQAEDLNAYFNSLPVKSKHAKKADVNGAKTTHAKNIKSMTVADMHAKLAKQAVAAQHAVARAAALPAAAAKPMSEVDEKKAAEEHESHKDELRTYKQHNAAFAKKMDQVHKIWLKTHDGLPKSAAEKEQYAHLVLQHVGDIAKIVTGEGAPAVSPSGVRAKKMPPNQASEMKPQTAGKKAPTRAAEKAGRKEVLHYLSAQDAAAQVSGIFDDMSSDGEHGTNNGMLAARTHHDSLTLTSARLLSVVK